MKNEKFDELPHELKLQYIEEALRDGWPLSAHKTRWLVKEIRDWEKSYPNREVLFPGTGEPK